MWVGTSPALGWGPHEDLACESLPGHRVPIAVLSVDNLCSPQVRKAGDLAIFSMTAQICRFFYPKTFARSSSEV